MQTGPIEIISNLYLGNKVDASSLELLNKAKISHILNVTPDLPNSFEGGFERCEGGTFHYTRLAVKDDWTGDLESRFNEAYEFIGNLSFYFISFFVVFALSFIY